MTNTNKLELPQIKGVLMPQLKHQWRVKFMGQNVLFTDEQCHLFARQMVACSFDYHLKTLVLNLEQDRFTTELHNIIKRFSTLSKTSPTDKISFVVDMLDGSDTTLKSFSFDGCVLTAHSFNLDYSESGSARHKIKFSYKTTKEL